MPPVVGVILMVAITIILAALAGTFVLGIGEEQDTTAPQAAFEFEWNGSAVTIVHVGGDSFTTGNTGNLTVAAGSDRVAWGGGADWTTEVPVTAGDAYVAAFPAPGETVRVIWTAPAGDESYTVGTFEVPG